MATDFIRNLTITLKPTKPYSDFADQGLSIDDPSSIVIRARRQNVSLDDPASCEPNELTLPVTYYADFDLCVLDDAGHSLGSVQRRQDHDARCRPDDERMIVEKRGLDGRLRERRRYVHGDLNDGVSGEPAHEMFTPEGRLLQRAFYSHGVLQDGRRGEPALTEYFADSEQARLVQRYLADELHDGPNGDPAWVEYSRGGGVAERIHFNRGSMIHDEKVPHGAVFNPPSRPPKRRATGPKPQAKHLS